MTYSIGIIRGTAAVSNGEYVGAEPGWLYIDTTNGVIYMNTGTASAPVWTVQ